MNRPLHTLFTLALAVTLGSCADHGPTAPPARSPLKLGLGEPVRLRGTDLFLSFDRVVAESRCPMGALCFQAGEVIVEMTASGRGRAATFQLHLTGMEGESESSAPPVSILGHRFRLFRLDPYPQINTPLMLLPPPVATLIVD
jgi:hypothetical protein